MGEEKVMPSISIRIRYHTSENSIGECGLNFASSTKEDFRATLRRHRIDPYKVFKFEIKKDEVYEEVPIKKLRKIFEEE